MSDHSAHRFAEGQNTDSREFQEYLEYLPMLDRHVLQLRYLRKKDPLAIAHQMRITPVHVNRIIARAQEFNALADMRRDPLPAFPVTVIGQSSLSFRQ